MGKGKRIKNTICSCGSGLRQNKCCNGRKPRVTSIALEMNEPTVASGYRISREGDFEIFSNDLPVVPKNKYLDVSYKRDSGKEKKILSIVVVK